MRNRSAALVVVLIAVAVTTGARVSGQDASKAPHRRRLSAVADQAGAPHPSATTTGHAALAALMQLLWQLAAPTREIDSRNVPVPAAAPLAAPAPAPFVAAPAPTPAPAPALSVLLPPADQSFLDISTTPPWAVMPPMQECGGQERQQRVSAERVADANSDGRRLDFVLYGDSITVLMHQQGSFSNNFGDLDAAALGMCGSSVANLVARILERGERPADELAPRVAALLIGANNMLPEKGLEPPAAQLEWLVRWMRANWPDTQVVVLALLPTVWPGVEASDLQATNSAYAELAARQGAAYVACGQELNPWDQTFFTDGLHPTPAGQDVVLACVREAVQRYLDGAA